MDTGFLLQSFRGLSNQEKSLLAQMFPDPQALLRLGREALEDILQRSVGRMEWNPQGRFPEALNSWKALDRSNIKVLVWEDGNYPAQLREIYDPPYRLYYRGTRPEWDAPLLALVGTRSPSEAGRKLGFDLGQEAARAGIWTVSGLARGVDEAVHRGTLRAKGRTLAVLACGLDQIYPRSNGPLARGILETGGCLVSEHPPLTPPLKHHFPLRNRIISGLSRGVVLVQAPEKSGALITTSLALEQGRDVFVCPRGYHPLVGLGGKALESQGAPGVYSLEEVFQSWGLESCRDPSPEYGRLPWTA